MNCILIKLCIIYQYVFVYSHSLHFEGQPKSIVSDEHLQLPDSVNNRF